MRRQTVDVTVGDLSIGSQHPIRVQSMTTTDTMNTIGTIEQSIRMIDAGCELVRVTAPSIREAKNLELIRKGLDERGYSTPLVADIHFTPNAADIAARYVEKVRINPGNFVDRKRFEVIEYSDDTYAAELDKIREKFTPLIMTCKEHGTALRIGTNHGSLSDRILSRFGDNPHGMVESAIEFLRIAEDNNYFNIVLSMKSSNTLVMVEAYRLLVRRLEEERLKPYPLHLGVTEAGDGEDGRVKSAVGIGTLLEDGLGDTIRVSLTEEPEAEIPVAAALARRYDTGDQSGIRHGRDDWGLYDPYSYHRRESKSVAVIGSSHHVPRVFADLAETTINGKEDLGSFGHKYNAELDKWSMTDQAAEFFIMGCSPLPFMPPSGTRQVLDVETWQTFDDQLYAVPLFSAKQFGSMDVRHSVMNVVRCSVTELNDETISMISANKTVVLILRSESKRPYLDLRQAFLRLLNAGCATPVIIERDFNDFDTNDNILDDKHVLFAATDVGGLFVDGFGDGVMLTTRGGAHPRGEEQAARDEVRLGFGILQATRTRMTKTEYISCPSCGRTLFDLQETTALIRSKTDHLVGVKIGIMGCIVNGPGEMADADYGYVGSGPGKITLYRGQEVVERAVPTAEAVNKLVQLIRDDGNWTESA